MNKYDSIIDFDYKMKHERMSINNRSAQFAPFSALTGYSELISEKGRLTDSKKEITDDIKEILDYKLKIINSKLDFHPKLSITYFIQDDKKAGGSYKTINEVIKKVDFYHKLIILENNERIKIENIINIDSFDVNFDDIL